MDDEAVVVDLSAAEGLPEEEVLAWAREQRVFVSSVMRGMEFERTAVATVVEELGATAVLFERFGGRDDDPEAAYLSEVASSDVYVGILGERYGAPLPTGYSATHAEYREAVRRGLRVSVWVTNGTLSGPQRDFVDEVRVFRTTGTYSIADDLAAGVARRLRALAGEALSPWVKVGGVVLRARRVEHDGLQVLLEARVRNDEVIAALEALRPEGTWRTSQDVSVTWAGRTVPIRVSTVRSETSAGRGGVVTLLGQCVERGMVSLVDVAVEGRTPEDLTELAVRVGLFGEEKAMSFMAKIDNPFDLIDRLGLPEDTIEPVARLFLTESLVGSSRADRITHLDVGPPHRGVRRVVLEWVPRRRYSNVIPEQRRVEGDVVARR
jgi:Domain of unknown function (DUF4062)